jgi:hypothetical protein
LEESIERQEGVEISLDIVAPRLPQPSGSRVISKIDLKTCFLLVVGRGLNVREYVCSQKMEEKEKNYM